MKLQHFTMVLMIATGITIFCCQRTTKATSNYTTIHLDSIRQGSSYSDLFDFSYVVPNELETIWKEMGFLKINYPKRPVIYP